jgi:hypothetical protein
MVFAIVLMWAVYIVLWSMARCFRGVRAAHTSVLSISTLNGGAFTRIADIEIQLP